MKRTVAGSDAVSALDFGRTELAVLAFGGLALSTWLVYFAAAFA